MRSFEYKINNQSRTYLYILYCAEKKNVITLYDVLVEYHSTEKAKFRGTLKISIACERKT